MNQTNTATNPKVDPKDNNNDDNEFATGFKEYAAEAKAEVERETHKIEAFFLSLEKKITTRIVNFSQVIEKSGKQIQLVGESIVRIGEHMNHYFDQSQAKPSVAEPIIGDSKESIPPTDHVH